MTIRRRLSAFLLVMSAIVLGLGAPASAGDEQRSAEEVREQVEAYRRAHPGDLDGLDKLQQSLGAEPMKVYMVGADGPVDAVEAERLLSVSSESSSGLAAAVPVDAFDVFLAVSRFDDPYVNQVNAVGSWNYRDDYVNGSAPDNISSLASESTCYNVTNTYLTARDYQGNDNSGLMYVSGGGLNGTTVAGIRDATSGFALLTDNGEHSTWYEAPPGCFDFRAEYRLEHNQDGGGISSVSAGFGFLTITYDSGPATLQKATGVVSP